MISPRSMIRNRSQQMISAFSSSCSDIENNRPATIPEERAAGTPKSSSGWKRWKWLCIIVGVGVVMYVLMILLSPLPLKEHRQPKEISHEQLTIVMNTFKRHDMMMDAIEHYSTCPLVKHIYIVWSEKEPPPQRISAKYANQAHPTVTFREEKVDSLNNRFRPIDGPHNDAIFSVDDDMRVPCEDLTLAHEVWRGSQRSIVGFMPRVHIRRNGLLEYRCWWRVWWHGTYSIILTKAAILHHEFFGLYMQEGHKEVRELVDKRRNCEDIAMQFLIANVTSLPPIYVKGHLDDKGALGGISTSQNVIKAGHMQDRSDCLNELERIYKKLPLIPSKMIVDSAGNGWTNVPSTTYEYLSSDLWKW